MPGRFPAFKIRKQSNRGAILLGRRKTMPSPTSDEALFRFCNPVKIVSGSKALEHLPVELGNHDAVRPMVVAHPKRGLRGRLRCLLRAFRDSGMTLVIYDHLPAETDLEKIKIVAGHFQESGCDALLALGQGALLHQAKAMRLFAQTSSFAQIPDGTLAESATGPAATSLTGGTAEETAGLPDPDPPEPAARIPLFWLPTGPGAGDELGGRLETAGQHMTHPHLRPQLACIDKRLLDSSDRDPGYLLDGVLIALVNAVEVCLLRGDNPFAVVYAEAAIKTIVATLTPEGLEAPRADILLALTNAAVWADCARDMQPPGLAHRLGRALAARVDLDAGLLMALCLPAVVDRALTGKTRLAAELLQLLGDAELYSLTEPQLRRPKCVNLLLEGWQALCENWPEALPGDLQATGIAREALREVARAAAPAEPQSALTILEHSWTLIPPLQLQAQATTAVADRHYPATTDPDADRGAQDAPAELL
jgi:alcohol dehydrogenase